MTGSMVPKGGASPGPGGRPAKKEQKFSQTPTPPKKPTSNTGGVGIGVKGPYRDGIQGRYRFYRPGTDRTWTPPEILRVLTDDRGGGTSGIHLGPEAQLYPPTGPEWAQYRFSGFRKQTKSGQFQLFETD